MKMAGCSRFGVWSILLVYGMVTRTYQEEGVMGEYCREEMFQVECGPDEVIVIEKARFGRMDYGRCIQKYIKGCQADVMQILDLTCSGRRLCEIAASDPKLLKTEPCQSEFSNYLAAKYRCQTVYTKHAAECEVYEYKHYQAISLSPDSGYIASMYSTPMCPYKIEASAGQKIALSLEDYASYTNRTSVPTQSDGSASACQRLFIISESNPVTSTPVCRNSYKHRVNLYVSESHVVEVEVTAVTTPFLIHYTVLGCPAVKKPSDSYFVRNTENHVIIRCNKTSETFEFLCQDGKWVGDTIRNCSNKIPGSDKGPGSTDPAIPEQHEDASGMPPLGMSLFIIFGVALVIVIYVAGMIVCFMYIKRKRKTNDRTNTAPPRKLDGSEEALQYDKIFTNPQEERLPMLSKMGTLRTPHQPQSQPQKMSDYSETTVCHIHGPISHNAESPYIVAGTDFCRCENCTNNMRSSTLPGCCIPANPQSATTKLDDSSNLTYESSRSLKGVRFATVNGSGKPISKNGAFYLELNSRSLNSAAMEKCPDVLPSELVSTETDTTLSTFR